jgi:DNA polymerase III subunit epsilon
MVKLIPANTPNKAFPQQVARVSPTEWARQLLARPADSWVILDTETTGFTGIDEVIELSVIDGAGQVLVDKKRFKPKCEIHPGAQEIHGIKIEDLQDEMDFGDFAEDLDAILHKRRIVIYNSNFDLRMLTQTAVIHSALSRVIFDDVTCAMLQYSAFVGEPKQRGNGYKFQALPGGDHTSLGDCQAVLELVKRMAGHG